MRKIRSLLLFVLGLAMSVSVAVPAPAQVRHFNPEKFDRVTQIDGDGVLQWGEHAQVRCLTCSGTGKMKCVTCERHPPETENCPDCKHAENRETVCHACGGEGHFPDPLEKVLCPGCMGAGFMLCGICPGSGILKALDAKRWSKCPGCRGDGVMPCEVCAGKRFIASIPLKPSLRDADVAALEKAHGQVAETLAELSAFEPSAKNTRREIKALAKILKGGEKVLPALKLQQKQLDSLMKSVFAGSQIAGQEEREKAAMKRITSGVEYLLKHQGRILEIALERARKNAG